MGKPSVSQAIGYLTAAGLRADRGYPCAPMPHITAAAVAVNVSKAENTAVTYSAVVCVPRTQGAAVCEDKAAKVAAAWSAKGAACTWGACGFDEAMGVYAMTVCGRWEDPPVAAQE